METTPLNKKREKVKSMDTLTLVTLLKDSEAKLGKTIEYRSRATKKDAFPERFNTQKEWITVSLYELNFRLKEGFKVSSILLNDEENKDCGYSE